MAQSWIKPRTNSLAEQFELLDRSNAYRGQNALNEAQAAELPYERERLQALNEANIAKAGAQAGKAESETTKTDAEFAIKMAEFVGRDPSNEQAVEGAFKFGAARFPALGPVLAKLESLRGTPEFAKTAAQFAMNAKDKAAEQLNERQFTETQKQSGIDNEFQQGQLSVSQGKLAVSQANAADLRRHREVMENKPEAGFSMTTNPDGTASFSYGTPAKNELEKKVISAEDTAARLSEIEKSANPENLTYQNQAWNAILDVKGKLGGTMSPEQQKFRDSMTDTRQATLMNINQIIKEQTGATMAVAEAQRIMATAPNTDDAPDVFNRKLTNMIRLTREAIARHKSALGDQGGTQPEAPPPNTPRTPVTAAPSQNEFDAMPMASKFKGRGITAPNGIHYTSDGKQWVRD